MISFELPPSPEAFDLPPECCTGGCGEEDEFAEIYLLMRIVLHPSAEDLAEVYHGEANGGKEEWVDVHLKYCLECACDMSTYARATEEVSIDDL